MGTGWLGWSADVTLDTHMALIVEAYEGRAEMLGAIFGGGKKGSRREPAPAQRREPEPRYVRGRQMGVMLNAFAMVHSKKGGS